MRDAKERPRCDEAERWAGALALCGGGWRLPTLQELRKLYVPGSTAGIGYLTAGRRFPAQMDPAFAGIGGGSWVWVEEEKGASGVAFNFNQGVEVTLSRTEMSLSVRAFAVRPARPEANQPPS